MDESRGFDAAATYNSLAPANVFKAGMATERVALVVRVTAISYVYFKQLCLKTSIMFFTVIVARCNRVAKTITSLSIVRKGCKTLCMFTSS